LDNGVQFTGKKTKTAMEQQFTAPYTPHQNPTERTNRTIGTMMAQITGVEQTKWDENLPELMLTYNSSTSESTARNPAQLLYGRELRLPKALFDEVTQGSGMFRNHGKMETTENDQNRSGGKYGRRSQAQKHHYDLRKREWKPEVGQIAWCKTHYLSNAEEKFNAILAPKYDGPWKVHSFLSPVRVITKDTKDTKTKLTIHLTLVEILNWVIIRAIFRSFHGTTWTNSDKQKRGFGTAVRS